MEEKKGLIIRECSHKDEKIWVQLNRNFMEYEMQDKDFWNHMNSHEEEKFARTFSEALQHPELITLLLIQIEGEVIGFANLLTIFSVWSHGKALILDDLYIEETYRGKGIGGLVMAYIETYATEKGFKRLQFQSEHSNPEAYEFYKKLGYNATEMTFYVRYL